MEASIIGFYLQIYAERPEGLGWKLTLIHENLRDGAYLKANHGRHEHTRGKRFRIWKQFSRLSSQARSYTETAQTYSI